MSSPPKLPPKEAHKFIGTLESFKKNHKPDILAIKALHSGHATEIQQKRALSFIIKYLCRADEINYFPGDERGTCFALGREAVGKILRGIALDSDYLEETL